MMICGWSTELRFFRLFTVNSMKKNIYKNALSNLFKFAQILIFILCIGFNKLKDEKSITKYDNFIVSFNSVYQTQKPWKYHNN